MRTICPQAAALVLALGSPSFTYAVPADQEVNRATATATATATAPQDRLFIREMAEAAQSQAEASLLAVLKAEDPTLRSFAREMVEIYEHRLTRLRQLAEARGIDLPSRPASSHQDRVALMQSMTPDRFQQEYARTYGVQNLQWMRSLAEQEIAAGQDREAQALAREVLPQLQANIRRGQALSALQVFPDSAQLR